MFFPPRSVQHLYGRLAAELTPEANDAHLLQVWTVWGGWGAEVWGVGWQRRGGLRCGVRAGGGVHARGERRARVAGVNGVGSRSAMFSLLGSHGLQVACRCGRFVWGEVAAVWGVGWLRC